MNAAAVNMAHHCHSPGDRIHHDPFELQIDASTRVRLRLVQPDDRARFSQGFQQLSDESRYCRCFGYRNSLSEAELDMLCNVDGIGHVALVALSLDEEGSERESIGGARFILPEHHDDEAEMAFLVTDAWQGRQVGQQLLAALINIAQARGIQQLRCHLLPGNFKARRLLIRVSQTIGGTLVFDEDGGLMKIGSIDGSLSPGGVFGYR